MAPLSVVTPRRLKPVLDEESSCWSRQLGWDFRSAATLIQQYVATRSLPGFALLGDAGEEVVGYAYYVIDQAVGYIGNLFVNQCNATAQAYRLLAERTVATLRQTSRLSRIECQLFPFNFEFPPIFGELEFEVRRRHFLGRPVASDDLKEAAPPAGFEFGLTPWKSAFFMQAAETVFDSYQGAFDQALCRDYQSLRGCIRFLRNLIESPGCGQFNPEASLLALDRKGRVAAVLVASQIGPGKAMIPQISVRRAYQGRGLGSLMLKRCFRIAAATQLDSVSLSVSESNSRACQLYRRLGFEDVKLFHAYVWNGCPVRAF